VNRPDDREDIMIAVTFAEAGDWETAVRYAPAPGTGRGGAWLERHLVAAALAEGGLPDDALRLVRSADGRGGRQPEEVALDALDALLRAHGLRMSCGVLSPVALGVPRG
jgi:hypothetical protein